MNKSDFFLVYRNWANKLACYTDNKLIELTAKQFEKLVGVTIQVEGTSYTISKDFVTKAR